MRFIHAQCSVRSHPSHSNRPFFLHAQAQRNDRIDSEIRRGHLTAEPVFMQIAFELPSSATKASRSAENLILIPSFLLVNKT